MKNKLLTPIGILSLSKAISEVGTALRLVIWPLYAYLISKDPKIIVIILAVEQIVTTIVSFFGSYISDVFNRKTMMILDETVSGLCTLSLFFLTKDTIYWAIPISIVWAFINTLTENANALFVNDIKKEDECLRQQFAKYDLNIHLVGATTILVGSGIAELIGARAIFIVDAITFFICAGLISTIKYHNPVKKLDIPGIKEMVKYYKEGLDYISQTNTTLKLLLFTTAGIIFTQGIAFTTHIQYMKIELDASNYHIGFWRLAVKLAFIFSSYLFLQKFIQKVKNTTLVPLGFSIIGMCYLAMFLSPNIWFFIGAMFVSSLGVHIYSTALKTETIAEVPNDMKSRMSGYRLFVVQASYAVGQVLNIWLITLASTGRFSYLVAFILDFIFIGIFFLALNKHNANKVKNTRGGGDLGGGM